MTITPVRPHDVRQDVLRLENTERCAEALRDGGPATIKQIAAATGLSKPTVKDRIRDLLELSLAVEVGREARAGQSSGRPASVYAFANESGVVVGVELGKHGDRVVLSDLAGRIMARRIFEADTRTRAVDRLAELAAHVAECLEDAGMTECLVALGAAVPGTIGPDGEMKRSHIFPEWEGQNLRTAFEQHFDVPLAIENDINAACIAEQRIGAASQTRSVVLVLLWHQVAAGILINGALHRGTRNSAGELNQLKSSHDAELSERWPSMPDLLRDLSRSDAGDDSVSRQLDRFAKHTAEQIAALALSIDPEVVLLYGPAAESPTLMARVRRALAQTLEPPVEVVLRTAELGQDGPVFGVILSALDTLNISLFGEGAGRAHQLIH